MLHWLDMQCNSAIYDYMNRFKNVFGLLKGLKTFKKSFEMASCLGGIAALATVDNKKTHPPLFQPFFPVYLRNHLSYKSYIYIFLYSFVKSFQLEQEFFKSGYEIS